MRESNYTKQFYIEESIRESFRIPRKARQTPLAKEYHRDRIYKKQKNNLHESTDESSEI
jgi:hypothetical protein